MLLPLQTGLRCKIVKTKKFPAKSSRIRSYGTFWRLLTAFGMQGDARGDTGTIGGKAPKDDCARNEELICTTCGAGLAVQAEALRGTCGAAGALRAMEFVVSHPSQSTRRIGHPALVVRASDGLRFRHYPAGFASPCHARQETAGRVCWMHPRPCECAALIEHP